MSTARWPFCYSREDAVVYGSSWNGHLGLGRGRPFRIRLLLFIGCCPLLGGKSNALLSRGGTLISCWGFFLMRFCWCEYYSLAGLRMNLMRLRLWLIHSALKQSDSPLTISCVQPCPALSRSCLHGLFRLISFDLPTLSGFALLSTPGYSLDPSDSESSVIICHAICLRLAAGCLDSSSRRIMPPHLRHPLILLHAGGNSWHKPEMNTPCPREHL